MKKNNNKKYVDLICANFAIPYYLEKYKDMITIQFDRDIYELVFTLPNNAFNKELLRKLFGVSMVTGVEVKSIFKHEDFLVVSEKIKKFLEITNLLK